MKSLLNNKMSASLRKTAVLAAAVASLSFAGTSWADTISVKHTDTLGTGTSGLVTGNSSNVLAGMFQLEVVDSPVSNTTGGNTPRWEIGHVIDAFCIDVAISLRTDVNMGFGINPQGEAPITPIDYNLTNLAFAQISWLYDNHGSNLGSSDTSDTFYTAFQLALWEILYEDSSYIGDLDGGDFTATGFGGDTTIHPDGAIGLAGDLLIGVTTDDTYISSTYEPLIMSAITPYPNQPVITTCNKITDEGCGRRPHEVSEPATLLLLSAGLGMIFFSACRRSLQV